MPESDELVRVMSWGAEVISFQELDLPSNKSIEEVPSFLNCPFHKIEVRTASLAKELSEASLVNICKCC